MGEYHGKVIVFKGGGRVGGYDDVLMAACYISVKANLTNWVYSLCDK